MAKHIPIVRFADDFVLMAETEKEAHKAHKFAQKKLKLLGLQLHPEKTQIIRSSRTYRFLGKRLPNVKFELLNP